MFYAVDKEIVLSVPVDHLTNPVDAHNSMDLVFVETAVRTPLLSSYTTLPEFYDTQTRKEIKKSKWTPQMYTFADREREKHPKFKKRFKVNYGTYIMGALLLLFAFFMVKRGADKPEIAKQNDIKFADYNMPEQVEAGNKFYGNYYEYKPGESIPKDSRFTWMKIDKVEGDTYYMALGKEFSKSATDEETLNRTDFEETILPMKIHSNDGNMVVFKNEDKTYEFSATKWKDE